MKRSNVQVFVSCTVKVLKIYSKIYYSALLKKSLMSKSKSNYVSYNFGLLRRDVLDGSTGLRAYTSDTYKLCFEEDKKYFFKCFSGVIAAPLSPLDFF